MKRKHIILGISTAFTLLIVILFVSAVMSKDEDWLYHFLDQYGPAEHKKTWESKNGSGEYVRYHIKTDYDSFTEAAKSKLLARGFSDLTEPDDYYRLQVYEKKDLERVQIEISFAIRRRGFGVENPVNSWIDVTVIRQRPKLSLRQYWHYLKWRFVKIRR